ncbi:MAG: TlpA family protein disulfide reductase [Candidatus Acidiferrales bacterium]
MRILGQPSNTAILRTGFICVIFFAIAASLGAQSSPAKPASPATKRATPAELTLIDLAGYTQVVSKFHGKPLLVTFWATWCEPCEIEFPMMVDLARDYVPKGLSVVGVNMDDDSDMDLVRHFLTKNHPDFRSYRQKPGIDLDGFYHGVNPAWNGAMPETIFYGRDGRIVEHFIGLQPRAAYESAIKEILASPAASNLRPLTRSSSVGGR